jgi:hypothetical protein
MPLKSSIVTVTTYDVRLVLGILTLRTAARKTLAIYILQFVAVFIAAVRMQMPSGQSTKSDWYCSSETSVLGIIWAFSEA